MPVTLRALVPSLHIEFFHVLLLCVVFLRYYSWVCVVRLMRVSVAITTVVAAVDAYQGVSSPLITVFLLLVVSTICGIVLW